MFLLNLLVLDGPDGPVGSNGSHSQNGLVVFDVPAGSDCPDCSGGWFWFINADIFLSASIILLHPQPQVLETKEQKQSANL